MNMNKIGLVGFIGKKNSQVKFKIMEICKKRESRRRFLVK
jgi:hypothetical protein